jgi:hypothetical protein
MIVTVASGTTAPLGSDTVTISRLRVEVCAACKGIAANKARSTERIVERARTATRTSTRVEEPSPVLRRKTLLRFGSFGNWEKKK